MRISISGTQIVDLFVQVKQRIRAKRKAGHTGVLDHLCTAIKHFLCLPIFVFAVPVFAQIDPNFCAVHQPGTVEVYFPSAQVLGGICSVISVLDDCNKFIAALNSAGHTPEPLAFASLKPNGSGFESCNMTMQGVLWTYAEISFTCSTPADIARYCSNAQATAPNKNNGDPSCTAGGAPHPINGSTGNKYWSDTDYSATAIGGLRFNRQYSSQNNSMTSTLGVAWHHSYDRTISTNIGSTPGMVANRPDGTGYIFTASGNLYTAQDGGRKDFCVD